MKFALPALLLALACATPAVADELTELRQALQDERTRAAREKARLQEELNELRRQLVEAQDEALRQARRFDQDRRRLQVEREQALTEAAESERAAQLERARLTARNTQLVAENSTLKQKLGKPADENDLLELRVSMLFDDASLEDALSYLEEISGITFHVHEDHLDTIKDAKLTLRLHELPLRTALELTLLNAKLAGQRLTLTWRKEDDGIYLQ